MADWIDDNRQARMHLLELLYAERHKARNQEVGGYVSRRDIGDAVAHADFHLAVLAELGYVRQDGMRWRITGSGVLYLESLISKE
jgi:hypothetical protein